MTKPRHRASRKLGARGVLALCAVVGIGLTGTAAAFNDSSATTGVVAAGTLDIQLGATAGTEGNATLDLLGAAVTNVKPGWSLTKTFSVKNAGTLPIRVTTPSTPTFTSAKNGSGADIPGAPAGTLSSQLDAVLTCGGSTMFAGGKLSALQFTTTTSFDLPSQGSTQTCSLTVSAPANLANTYQGYSDALSWTLSAATY